MITCGIEEKMFDESFCKTCDYKLLDDDGRCMFATHHRELDAHEYAELRKSRRNPVMEYFSKQLTPKETDKMKEEA